VNRSELLLFVRSHRYAVQASISPSGAPQAAVVGIAVTDSFEIVFDSVDTTRKARNLGLRPMATFVIGGWTPGDERTVQYEGIADQPEGQDLERVKATYYESFPDGRERLTWPGLVYFRVRPTWIRYSNFNVNPPEVLEFQAEQLRALG
jgi:hypothetical protein